LASAKILRPADEDYFVEPWSENHLQGDVFADVPLAIPAPPDAVLVGEKGEGRFLSGPFEAGLAMLISPSCTLAAQGPSAQPGTYRLPARTLVPIRPVADLEATGTITEKNIDMLRLDRLRNYFYVPATDRWPESVALLYLPITVHQDVVDDSRIRQLTGTAFWHLRVKLMAFTGGFVLHPNELGDVPAPTERTS